MLNFSFALAPAILIGPVASVVARPAARPVGGDTFARTRLLRSLRLLALLLSSPPFLLAWGATYSQADNPIEYSYGANDSVVVLRHDGLYTWAVQFIQKYLSLLCFIINRYMQNGLFLLPYVCLFYTPAHILTVYIAMHHAHDVRS